MHTQKWPNLKWKTRPKQLLGYILLAFVLTDDILYYFGEEFCCAALGLHGIHAEVPASIIQKWSNLKWKTQPNHNLGYLLLAFDSRVTFCITLVRSFAVLH
jgi:hypothetical protein